MAAFFPDVRRPWSVQVPKYTLPLALILLFKEPADVLPPPEGTAVGAETLVARVVTGVVLGGAEEGAADDAGEEGAAEVAAEPGTHCEYPSIVLGKDISWWSHSVKVHLTVTIIHVSSSLYELGWIPTWYICSMSHWRSWSLHCSSIHHLPFLVCRNPERCFEHTYH